jgi:hypothetical protein
VEEQFRDLPLLDTVDVLVIGSGSAGSTAAIAAARTGARTMLVERYGYMGGISTGVLDTFYGFYTPGVSRKIVGGIPDEVARELMARGAAFLRPSTYGAGTGVTYDPEILKMVWEDLAVGAGVLPLFHTFCTGVIAEDNGSRVAGVVIDGKLGLMRIMARQVIDASGDADVCYLAGVPYEKAGDLEAAQSLTTTFRLANVDVALAGKVTGKELHALMKEANESGLFHLPREEGSIHRTPIEGVMHSNMTRMDGYDPTDPVSLTQAEIEGRRQTREYVRFLQERVPGYARARLVWLSTQIGIRETRRVYGDYRLTIEDVMAARKFGDTVGQCGAPVEDHHGGSDTKWVYISDSGVYDIPFRTLIPQGLDNVLVAGRCFSATHEAHASCRSMAQTMTMGQAAGVAAAVCVQHDASPRTLNLQALQEHLVGMGAVLYDDQHVPAEEPSDKPGVEAR